MIQINEYFQNGVSVEKLGWSSEAPQYISEDYLKEKFFVVFRTCQSFGDWAIISAMPRLLKQKYPDATVAVPSPTLIKNMYPNGLWTNKADSFHNNVAEVFSNNPHVDGMIDEFPLNKPVFHDHFRIYNPQNLNIPLTEQMLLYWRFQPEEISDSAPELYWSDEEKQQGKIEVAKNFGANPFGFLYIDDSFFEVHDPIREPLDYKRKKIQEKIEQFDSHYMQWFYFAGKDISETCYKTKGITVNIQSLSVSRRVQSYIKSLSSVVIGHQGGYGTDCMSRYPKNGCYVVPNTAKHINEHFVRTTTYLLP